MPYHYQMNKTQLVLCSIIAINTLFHPVLKAQSNCESITESLVKQGQKHEKFGALYVLGKSEARIRTMGQSEARNQGMILMSEAVTAYMQANLKDQLLFTDEAQQGRFEMQLLGKSEKGTTDIAGQSYHTTYTSVNLTLNGVREVNSNECEAGHLTNYYKLMVMTPEGIFKTIEEAIISFAEKDESPANALLDSWEKSTLKASLLELQKKYEKKMN